VELKEEITLLEIKTFQDLYYALKSRKELRESNNPKFGKLKDNITKQIENLVD
jgi:hypothetical protein